jgi:hypothetical protein
MEAKKTRMKSLTIIFPIHPLERDISKRISDLESFFAKWPLVTDLLFVLEPGSETIRAALEAVKHEKIKLHFVQNERFLGRGLSLQKGLSTASGDLVILGAFDLSIPMAEYFNLIHEAISVPSASMFKGNRFTSRKKQTGVRRKWHRVLEDIILEKWRSGRLLQTKGTDQRSETNPTSAIEPAFVQDPLCSLYALRQPVVERLRGDRPLRQWYYGLDLLQWCFAKDFKLVEIPVVNTVDERSKIPLLREFSRNLF